MLNRRRNIHGFRRPLTLRERLLQAVVPVCFFLGVCLMMVQIASVTQIFEVEVTIHSGRRLDEYRQMLHEHEPGVELTHWAKAHLGLENDGEEEDEEDVAREQAEKRVREEEALELEIVQDSSFGYHSNDQTESGGVDENVNDVDDVLNGQFQTKIASSMIGDSLDEFVISKSNTGLAKEQNEEQDQRGIDENDQEEEEEGEGLEDGSGGEQQEITSAAGKYDGKEVTLNPQIELPKRPIVKSYNSGQNFWPWYKILKKHGWAHATDVTNLRANMLFSKGAVPYLRKGKQMLNSIGVSGCIGGAKLLQLACRRNLAEHYGCKYENLKIQPMQFSIDTEEGCREFFEIADLPENEKKLWLFKPSNTFHGKGIKLYTGPNELRKRVNNCKSPKPAIAMEYVAKPATMHGGYKFDLRSYLLVGSLDPKLIFFADGFIRKADTPYATNDTRTKIHVTNHVSQDKDNHFFSYQQMGEALVNEMGFPEDYLDRAREYMKKVSLYVFKTTEVQKKPLSRFPGRFHLFAIDWIIDETGGIHLLEGNGYPLVTEYPVPDLTPIIWEDLIDLVLKIHIHPEQLDRKFTVKDQYKHGKWSLIYNELEEQHSINVTGMPLFRPCEQFPSQIELTTRKH